MKKVEELKDDDVIVLTLRGMLVQRSGIRDKKTEDKLMDFCAECAKEAWEIGVKMGFSRTSDAIEWATKENKIKGLKALTHAGIIKS